MNLAVFFADYIWFDILLSNAMIFKTGMYGTGSIVFQYLLAKIFALSGSIQY